MFTFFVLVSQSIYTVYLTDSLGWRGSAQHVFLQPDPAGDGCGIDGANDELALDALPRSAPDLYNVTVSGASPQAGRARR